jgi:hypothetical protein
VFACIASSSSMQQQWFAAAYSCLTQLTAGTLKLEE